MGFSHLVYYGGTGDCLTAQATLECFLFCWGKAGVPGVGALPLSFSYMRPEMSELLLSSHSMGSLMMTDSRY